MNKEKKVTEEEAKKIDDAMNKVAKMTEVDTIEVKEGFHDRVSEVMASMPGRLKMIRRDGVSSPWCNSVLITDTVDAMTSKVITSLDDALNSWAEENASQGFLVFEMIPITAHSILVIYTKEIGSKQAIVLERYGRKISEIISQMDKRDAEMDERNAETSEAAEIEKNRLAAIGEQYEKRLKSVKKLPDSKDKKELFRELEAGGVHLDKMFDGLTTVMKNGGELAKFAQTLGDQLGFGGLLRVAVSENVPTPEQIIKESVNGQE